jgi:hypothetical protein
VGLPIIVQQEKSRELDEPAESASGGDPLLLYKILHLMFSFWYECFVHYVLRFGKNYQNVLMPDLEFQSAGCSEDRYSLCGRIWQHALGGQNGAKSYASPAGMRTECGAGSLNWSIFSTSTVSTFVS